MKILDRVVGTRSHYTPVSTQFSWTDDSMVAIASGVSRADMACHWEDTDAVVQEVFITVRVLLPLCLLATILT